MPLKGLHSVVVVPATLTVTAGGEQRGSGKLGDRMEMEELTAAQRRWRGNADVGCGCKGMFKSLLVHYPPHTHFALG